MAEGSTRTEALQLWPIFICYRRVDGSPVARRLYELLHRWQAERPGGTEIEIDAYLDETMPGVADWRELHGPYLKRARAMVIVCTPGVKLNEGPEDWVHREIDWWMEHRETAPILIDAFNQGPRYVPDQVAERWPEIQRISMVEQEWIGLADAELAEKAAAVRRHVVGAILPSGAAVYAQELEAERERVRRLELSEKTTEASLLDARAASLFAESRFLQSRLDIEKARRSELTAKLSSTRQAPSSIRHLNLMNERDLMDEDILGLRSRSREQREEGVRQLRKADQAWAALSATGHGPPDRSRPDPPHVFSVELLNAGYGECILLHYGAPGDVRLVMLNCGPRKAYRRFLEPRLQELSAEDFSGGPVPLELLIISDRDEEKTGGLAKLLDRVAEADSPDRRLVDIKGIWANIFRTTGMRGLRPAIHKRIDELALPWNRPFDRLVLRPGDGRAVVSLPDELQIVILGPDRRRLEELHQKVTRDAQRHERGTIEPFPETSFSAVEIESAPMPLVPPASQPDPDSRCVPSDNARKLAGGVYQDMSAANLASTILLFRNQGRTFLHTGDARGDLIVEGLETAGLMDDDGRAHVDLLSIPHFGSARTVTPEFFERVRADNYLFSGDGRHGNPEISTVAALIAARGCERYRMYFVNRDGEYDDRRGNEHGRRLDEFFKAERAFHPAYRRVFRSEARGSVIIDLADPIPRRLPDGSASEPSPPDPPSPVPPGASSPS